MLEAVSPYVGWIVLGVFIVIILLMLWKKAPQDKAIVVTGLKRRVISGSGGIVIPYLEQISRISNVDLPTFGKPAITMLIASKSTVGMFLNDCFAKSRKSRSFSIL